MAQVQKILEAALRKAGISDPDQTADSEDLATALEEYKDMMLEWHERGIWINYSEPSVATDTDTTHEWTRGCQKSALALRLCSEYDEPIPQGLAITFERQWSLLISRVQVVGESDHPDTFPTGEGNRIFGAATEDEFYYEPQRLSASGGNLTDEAGYELRTDGARNDGRDSGLGGS
jgi:hypothetical protein